METGWRTIKLVVNCINPYPANMEKMASS